MTLTDAPVASSKSAIFAVARTESASARRTSSAAPGRGCSLFCWVAMAGIGVLQYGYGVALTALHVTSGKSLAGALWVLALWVVFQAGAAAPTAVLSHRFALTPARAVPIGAAAVRRRSLDPRPHRQPGARGPRLLRAVAAPAQASSTPRAPPPSRSGTRRSAQPGSVSSPGRSAAVPSRSSWPSPPPSPRTTARSSSPRWASSSSSSSPSSAPSCGTHPQAGGRRTSTPSSGPSTRSSTAACATTSPRYGSTPPARRSAHPPSW